MGTRVTDIRSLTDVMVAATAPTVRDNGDALQVDDKWLDLATPAWNVWDGTAWQPLGGGTVSWSRPFLTMGA